MNTYQFNDAQALPIGWLNINTLELVPLVGIGLAFLLLFFGLMGWVLLTTVKAWRDAGRNRSEELEAAESRAFQELQSGFLKMEKRMESLETMLIEQASSPLESQYS